jgi:hypothetical protein
VKGNSVYSTFSVKEEEIDKFNDFLEKKEPAGLEALLVDKRLPGRDQVEVLQEEWTEYKKAGYRDNEKPEPINLLDESRPAQFIYKVQITACRTQLTPAQLRRVYKGTEEIVESFEDNWFKYTIGNFNSYSEAQKLKLKSEVKSAFIVSYLNGKRFRISLGMTRS